MDLDSPPPIAHDSANNSLLLLLRPESTFGGPSASGLPTAPDTSTFNASPAGRIQEARTPDQARTLLDNSLNDLLNQVLDGHSVVAVSLPSPSKLETSQAYQNIMNEINRKSGSLHAFPFQKSQIISRAVEILFDKLKVTAPPLTQFTISVTHAVVRHQEIVDLNLPSSSPDDVFFYQKPFESNQDLNKSPWPSLTKIQVHNASEALELLRQGTHAQQTLSEDSNSAHNTKSNVMFSIILSQHKLSEVTYRPNTGTRARKFRMNTSRAMSVSSSNLINNPETVTTSTLLFLDVAYSETPNQRSSFGKQIKQVLPHHVKTDMQFLAKLISPLGDQADFKSFLNNNSNDGTKFNGILRSFSRKKALGVVLSLPCSSERQLSDIFISLQENHFEDSNQPLVVENVAPTNAKEVHEQVTYLQTTIAKLHEELLRVRESTSITDLSNARISLSSVETELSCEIKPNVRYRQVSRHLTQIQGCYSRAFSDIFQAVSRQSNSTSDRRSIRSVYEEKIDPIVKEFEHSIQALELELANIRNSATPLYLPSPKESVGHGSRIPSHDRLPLLATFLNARDHSNHQSTLEVLETRSPINTSRQSIPFLYQPSKNSSSSSVISSTPDSDIEKRERDEEHRASFERLEDTYEPDKEKILVEKNSLEINLDKHDGFNLEIRARRQVASFISAKSDNQEHPIDIEGASLAASQRTISQNSMRPASAASSYSNDMQSESRSSREFDNKLLNDFHTLQIRHKTVVDELEQVRAQYINTLKELEATTAQRDTTQRSSTVLQTRRPSLPLTHNYIASSSSSLMSAPSSPALSSRAKIQGLLYNGGISPRLDPRTKPDYYEGPQRIQNEADDLLETLDTHDDDPDAYGSHGDDEKGQKRNSARIIMANRIYSGTPRRQVKRCTSNSGLSALQPLKLPLMRSLSLSSPQLSFFEEMWKSPASRALHSSHSDCSLPSNTHAPPNVDEQQHVSQGFEQSYTSLEKEVIKLQEALKEREEEIQMLEANIRIVPPSIGSVVIPLENDDRTPKSSNNQTQSTAISDSSEADQNRYQGRRSQDDCLEVRPSHKRTAHGINYNENDRADNVESLNLVMRSMAKKESGFLELIESLKSQLQIAKRQHEDLVKLSSDQVVNMSSEIEALRKELATLQTSNDQANHSPISSSPTTTTNPNNLLQLPGDKVQENHSREDKKKSIEDQEESDLENLKTKQVENMKQVILATTDAIGTKEQEIKDIELQWQAKLESELIAQANYIWALVDAQRSKSIKDRLRMSWVNSSEAQQKVFDDEISNLVKQHAESTEMLKQEMNMNLKTAEMNFEQQILEINAHHAIEINQLNLEISSRIKNEEELKSNGITSNGASTQDDIESIRILKTQSEDKILGLENEKANLISLYENRIKTLKKEYQSQLSQLQDQHKETLVGSLSALDQRRSRVFEARLKENEDHHHSQIAELKLKFHQQHRVITHHENPLRSSMFAQVEEAVEFPTHPMPSMSANVETWPQDERHKSMKRTEITDSHLQDPYATINAPPELSINVRRASATHSFHSLSASNYSAPDSPVGSIEGDSIQSMILNPDIARKIQDQESHISKLSQNLIHCESKLKENLSVVSRLEAALEASDRNLKKTRHQMSGWVQERDKSGLQNEDLRNQLNNSNLKIERLEKMLLENTTELKRQLEQSSAVVRRESVFKQLDARINEITKNQGKKSKFNCF